MTLPVRTKQAGFLFPRRTHDTERNVDVDGLASRRAGNRYAEIARLLTRIAELQAWQDAVPVDAIAFLVGATEAILGESWQSKTATEWANSMPK